jgi:hypothetical protein
MKCSHLRRHRLVGLVRAAHFGVGDVSFFPVIGRLGAGTGVWSLPLTTPLINNPAVLRGSPEPALGEVEGRAQSSGRGFPAVPAKQLASP